MAVRFCVWVREKRLSVCAVCVCVRPCQRGNPSWSLHKDIYKRTYACVYLLNTDKSSLPPYPSPVLSSSPPLSLVVVPFYFFSPRRATELTFFFFFDSSENRFFMNTVNQIQSIKTTAILCIALCTSTSRGDIVFSESFAAICATCGSRFYNVVSRRGQFWSRRSS